MFQLRGEDPWVEAASGDIVDANKPTEIVDRISNSLRTLFSPSVTITTTTPTPGTKMTTATPKKAWFKTPLGIIGILGVAFIGYKGYKSYARK